MGRDDDMKSSVCGIWLLWIFMLLALPLNSEAREFLINPELAIAGHYDDNVAFTSTEPDDDYASIINPALELEYVTEQTNLKPGGDLLFFNYLEQTEWDTTIQEYFLDINSQLSERFLVITELNYVFDTLLDSELEQTGRVFEREDRERFDVSTGIEYGLSPKSDLGLRYEYSYIDYQEGTRSDRNEQKVLAKYDRMLNDGLDKITVQPSYSFSISSDDIIDASTDTDTIYGINGDLEVNTYSLNIGWTRQSSEVGTIRIFGGARYTEESRVAGESGKEIEKTDNTGFVADLSYALKDQISLFSVGYRRDITFDANNDLRELDFLYAEYNYSLTERMSFYIKGSFYFTRSEEESGEDSNYFDGLSWLDYRLTERHSLIFTYRYSQENSNDEGEEAVRRNQVFLSLAFRFPKKF